MGVLWLVVMCYMCQDWFCDMVSFVVLRSAGITIVWWRGCFRVGDGSNCYVGMVIVCDDLVNRWLCDMIPNNVLLSVKSCRIGDRPVSRHPAPDAGSCWEICGP